jgi:hypothetical protein
MCPQVRVGGASVLRARRGPRKPLARPATCTVARGLPAGALKRPCAARPHVNNPAGHAATPVRSVRGVSLRVSPGGRHPLRQMCANVSTGAGWRGFGSARAARSSQATGPTRHLHGRSRPARRRAQAARAARPQVNNPAGHAATPVRSVRGVSLRVSPGGRHPLRQTCAKLSTRGTKALVSRRRVRRTARRAGWERRGLWRRARLRGR